LPDGLSEIFFASDLDRANQLDAAGEFSFEAQRRGRPQRVDPANPAFALSVSRAGTLIWLYLRRRSAPRG
jgi:hypothetical protein